MPLSLRLHAARELLSHKYPLHEYQCDDAAAAIEDQFLKTSDSKVGAGKRTHREEEEADKGPALDAYFQRVQSELVELATPEAAQSPVANAKLEALVGATARRVCADCSSAAPAEHKQHVCRWTSASEAADVRAVASHGACLEPARELFLVACDVSREAYRRACGATPSQLVVLGTICAAEANHVLEISIDGVTHEVSPLKKRMVELSFHVESLAPDDYLAQLYVLFHEVLVHAFCGVELDDDSAPESAAFHEGWMDCVAAEVLKKLPEYNVQAESPAVRFHGQFIGVMETVREYRFNTARPVAAVSARNWRRGRTACDAMRRILREAWEELEIEAGLEVSSAADKAAADLLTLSLQLNASQASDAERGDFTAALNQLFTRCADDDFSELLKKHEQVVDFAKDFVRGGPWQELVTSVVLYADERH